MKIPAALSILLLLATTPTHAAHEEIKTAIQELGGAVLGGPSGGYNVRFRGRSEEPLGASELALIVQLEKVSRISLGDTENDALPALEPIADQLQHFSISSSILSDEVIPHLTMFENLVSFGMRTDTKQPPITVEGMRQLEGAFPKVRELGIGGHDFPPQCLALLPELFPQAETVDFNHTFRADDTVLTAFQDFENLKSLNLGGCYKSDEATMRSLGGLRDLERLSVFHAGPFQWAALEALEGHPNLRSLYVGDGRPKHKPERRCITDADLELLLTMPNLEAFQTGADANGGITDAAGAILARHPNLKSLTLSRPEFTDAILPPLAKAPAIEELVLEFDHHDAAGLAVLKSFPQLRKLRLGGYRQGTPVDAARLAALHELPAIEEIDIRMDADSQPPQQAIDALVAAHPEAKVRVSRGLDHR